MFWLCPLLDIFMVRLMGLRTWWLIPTMSCVSCIPVRCSNLSLMQLLVVALHHIWGYRYVPLMSCSFPSQPPSLRDVMVFRTYHDICTIHQLVHQTASFRTLPKDGVLIDVTSYESGGECSPSRAASAHVRPLSCIALTGWLFPFDTLVDTFWQFIHFPEHRLVTTSAKAML